jgi:L-threonylcarbamoyladenylate synthase
VTEPDEIVAAIRAGNPVLLPTDTVYGLCADPYREAPALRVSRLKGRDESQPMALLAAELDMVFELVPEARGKAGAAARSLLPGPFTVVLPNPARRFRWLTGSRPETIGVRVPELPPGTRAVVERAGAVLATSANRHGGSDPRRLEEVPDEIRVACAAELDAGELPGVPSTVIDLTGPEPVVLREGAVPASEALARLR